MNELVKYHTVVTTVQLGIILLSLCITSLGIVIKHPYLIYFWYLGLFCMVTLLVTSILVAVALVLARVFKSAPRLNQRWLSVPKSIRT